MPERDDIFAGKWVPWWDVPNWTLVQADGHLIIRGENLGRIVGRDDWWVWHPEAPGRPETARIVALNVPATAPAEHLQELAERFEVRDFLTYGDTRLEVEAAARPYLGDCEGKTHREIKDLAAARLYDAGFRMGDPPDLAVDLLALPFMCRTCGALITTRAELLACRGAGPVR